MANIKFNRKEFEKYIKITKQVEDKIPLMGTPLESLTKDEIEIEIFPNRPDLLSMQGYVRALNAFLGKTKAIKKYKVEPPGKDFTVKIGKSVEKIRPFTACAIVKNLKLDDEKIKEIIELQEKIHTTLGRNRKKVAIGIYPLEKIKLPITFEARPPKKIKFTPLEFDRELTGNEILSKHPAGREYGPLLEGKEKYPIFIDSDNEILSMPPIINSHKTGKITEKTKNVFVECSGFDFDTLSKTLNIIVTTLSEMSGKIYSMNLKYSDKKITTPNLKPEKKNLNIKNAEKLLGIKLTESEVKKLLEKMDISYNKEIAEIPAWRTDILHENDIIEDIAIAYGYDNFIPELPDVSSTGQESNTAIKKRKISEILVGLNMLEISTFHLTKKQDQFKKMCIKIKEKECGISVLETKTDYSVLRENLLHSSIRVLSENVDVEYPQKIFETGIVFEEDEKTESSIKEKNSLCVVMTPSNFTEAKQTLEYLGKMIDIEFEIKEKEHPSFIEGRVGKIIYNNKEIGVIGEIHPSVLKNWHLKFPVSSFEINLDEII